MTTRHIVAVTVLLAAAVVPVANAVVIDVPDAHAPTGAADTAADPTSYAGDCTHPLFAAAVAYAAGDGPASVAIGDLDGVNGPDLAVANFVDDDVSVLLNNGDGTFAPAAAYAAGNLPTSVAIGDLDGVNGPDLAVANSFSDNVSVLLNQGDGTFENAIAKV